MNNQTCDTTSNVVGRSTQKHMRGGWAGHKKTHEGWVGGGGGGQAMRLATKQNEFLNKMWPEDTQLILIHNPSQAMWEKNVFYFVRSSASGKPHFLT